MDQASAQAFEKKRTQWGNVNRSIVIAATIKLDKKGFTIANDVFGGVNATTSGTLVNATIYASSRLQDPLYVISAADLQQARAAQVAAAAAQRAAEARQLAKQQREALMAQRQEDITLLAQSTPSTRLANWISTGPLDFSARLESLRGARTAALLAGRPVTVQMLVQADEGGRDKIASRWPGHLRVTVPSGQPALRASHWYLVQGALSVPEKPGLQTATLAADRVYACTQAQCRDAMNATAIVDRKLAALESGH